MEPKTVMEELQDILVSLKEDSRTKGSRELSLAITKIEEAIMWFDKAGYK